MMAILRYLIAIFRSGMLFFVNHFDRVQARGDPRRIQSGQHRNHQTSRQRARQQCYRGMELDGPAEALLVDYVYQ